MYYKSQNGTLAKISTMSNKIMAVKMAKFFREFNPDLVISTHPFGSQMTSYLKKKGKTSCKLATIMTDFAPHDQWLVGSEFVDYYFVSNDIMKQKIVDKFNIEKNKIFVTGIPISKRFLQDYNYENTIRLFDLKPNKKTILFFGGGAFGLGKDKTVEILRTLASSSFDIQVIAIAGKNEKMQQEFEKIVTEFNKSDSIKILPFTDKVPELMSISDLVITKPGGLTTSESLASNLPIIVINPIPGQEEENAEFLENSGAAIWLNASRSPEDVFNSVLSNDSKISQMKSCVAKIAKRNSTKDICEILFS